MLELEITIAGQTIILSGHKSAFDPAQQVLYIADLHAGKAATLRMHGVPVPEQMLKEDLNRLSFLIQHYQPAELVVLGDFFHAREGRKTEVFELLSEFRDQHSSLNITIVEGNHDRASGVPPLKLNLKLEQPGLKRGGFELFHYPQSSANTSVLSGHLHPAVRVPNIGKLPCFLKMGNQLILPGFGATTAGSLVRREKGKEFFVVTPDQEVMRF